MIEIRHRPAVVAEGGAVLPEEWEVECCTSLAAVDHGWDRITVPTPITVHSEADAIRAAAAHLADEHGVMVIREIVLVDLTPCPGPSWTSQCIAGVWGAARCRCDGSGVLRAERTVTVDQHTVEATR